MRLPATILRDIENVLKPLIHADGGTLDVASKLDDALEMLAVSPKTFRVVLVWDGYGSHPNNKEGMAVNRFTTFLHVNHGLAKDQAAKIYKESINAEMPFMDRLELLSQWMRALRWPHGSDIDPHGMALEDSEWVSDTPGNTVAHALTWSLDQSLAGLGKNLVIPIDTIGDQNYERPIN